MSTRYFSEADMEFVSNFRFHDIDDCKTHLPAFPVAVAAETVADNRAPELEPMPIAQDNMVVVKELPVTASFWESDRIFIDSMKTLLKEFSYTAPSLTPLTSRSTVTAPKNESPSCTHDDTNSTSYVSLESAVSDSEDSDTTSSRLGHQEQWNRRYNELVRFRKEHGHCLVSLNRPANPCLAHWVKRQRYQFRMKQDGKHSTLTAERQKALESLGFVWDSHAAAWEERWNELRDFKERYGHCNVPKKYPENQQLAVWVKCQRRQYKLLSTGQNSNMTQPRIEQLQVLGFVFNPRLRRKRMSFSTQPELTASH